MFFNMYAKVKSLWVLFLMTYETSVETKLSNYFWKSRRAVEWYLMRILSVLFLLLYENDLKYLFQKYQYAVVEFNNYSPFVIHPTLPFYLHDYLWLRVIIYRKLKT